MADLSRSVESIELRTVEQESLIWWGQSIACHWAKCRVTLETRNEILIIYRWSSRLMLSWKCKLLLASLPSWPGTP